MLYRFHNDLPTFEQEYCIRHGYGPFLVTDRGLYCFECFKNHSGDYEACEACGHDHVFEQKAADDWHTPPLPGIA